MSIILSPAKMKPAFSLLCCLHLLLFLYALRAAGTTAGGATQLRNDTANVTTEPHPVSSGGAREAFLFVGGWCLFILMVLIVCAALFTKQCKCILNFIAGLCGLSPLSSSNDHHSLASLPSGDRGTETDSSSCGSKGHCPVTCEVDSRQMSAPTEVGRTML